MNRETMLGLFASAIAAPMAVSREWMDALGAAAAGYVPGQTAERGARLAPTPLAAMVRLVPLADLEDDHDDDDLTDDVDTSLDESQEGGPNEPPEQGEDGAAAHPDQSDDGEEGDGEGEYHPDPSSRVNVTPPSAAAVHPATLRAVAKRPGSIAVIAISGSISSKGTIWDYLFDTTPTTPANIAKAVTDAANDTSVKAIILNVDSGGGPTVGITECFDAIFAVRGKKPIIGQVCGTCASAAYWLISACDEIGATPSATIGSIGCYMGHDDVSGALENLGVKRTYIQAGEFKTETAPEFPLSDAARAHLQEYVDDFMAQFAANVSAGRGVPAATVTGPSYGQGRGYVAARALKRGMIDKVRTLEDTLASLGASISDAQPTAKRGRATALLKREVAALDL